MDRRDEQARNIFLDALEIAEAEQRQEFLDSQCGEDEQLREEVGELLQHHIRMGSFLNSPALDNEATEELPPSGGAFGEMIGPYKLLQKLGEGGMGVVYMAEQIRPVKRRVALKIIKPGMDSKQVIARFEAERQALAMMEHPNIAKVLGAGTTSVGHPYFVMELVKGIPITTYCDEQHLTPRERLQLFVCVCHAVQHAHQKGVIHRDLKPTNILIAHYDNKPVVKVIDFGLAKATGQQLTEKTLVTFVGQVAGTLEYMSPEQARFNQLDVDTRTDIYSLGVVLYELLTGATPFDRERFCNAAIDEIVRIIRDEDPPKPSTRVSTPTGKPPTTAVSCRTEASKLLALLRGDLDWLVMKALDKERERRYETANSFATDIERYLNGEPIEARPPTPLYRLRKTVSRHRMAMATTATVILVLLGGFATTTWQWKVAVTQERIALAAKERAIKAEKETRKTMTTLQEEIYERALNEALLGGTNSLTLINQAKDVGIPEPKLKVLQGLRAFYRGQLQQARRLLEEGERSVASRAVLAWTYSVAGNHTRFADVAIELQGLKPVSPTDYLLLGQLYSAVLPSDAVVFAEKGLEQRDSSVLGHAIHAITLANLGLNHHDSQLAKDAIAEVQACQTFRRDNVFVLSASLQVHCVAYRIAELTGQDDDASRFLTTAKEVAERLGRVGGKYVAWDRASFLSVTGQVDEAMVAWKECLRPSEIGFTPMLLAPFARLHGRQEEALEMLKALDGADNLFVRMAIAFLQADNPDYRQQLMNTYEHIVAGSDKCDPHLFALQLLMMSGQPQRAREEANRLLSCSRQLILPYKAHIRYLAGQGTAKDLLRESPYLGHYDIALQAYAEDDLATARHHFRECEKGTFLCAQYWWSKVYLAEMPPDEGPEEMD